MSTDLVVQNQELSTTLFGTDNPAEVVARAAVVATALADLVHRQNLTVRIQASDYVRVEGWTLLGSMLGVFPVVVWTHPVLENEQTVGWEARVEARTRAGEVVGAAEAQCLRDEKSWKGRDDFALRSMAQTRAVSKALRLPLGFVMQLAGFNPTPAEEMPVIEGRASAGGNTADAVPADDPAAGTPFGDDIDAPVEPAGSKGAGPPSAAMLKKLNVLVGKLRPDHLSTLHLYQSMGKDPRDFEGALEFNADDPDAAPALHWSPLRDSLTFSEAMQLIDRLEKYAADKLGPST